MSSTGFPLAAVDRFKERHLAYPRSSFVPFQALDRTLPAYRSVAAPSPGDSGRPAGSALPSGQRGRTSCGSANRARTGDLSEERAPPSRSRRIDSAPQVSRVTEMHHRVLQTFSPATVIVTTCPMVICQSASDCSAGAGKWAIVSAASAVSEASLKSSSPTGLRSHGTPWSAGSRGSIR